MSDLFTCNTSWKLKFILKDVNCLHEFYFPRYYLLNVSQEVNNNYVNYYYRGILRHVMNNNHTITIFANLGPRNSIQTMFCLVIAFLACELVMVLYRPTQDELI